MRELIATLQETYCRTIGVEFMHIRDVEIRQWLLERMEPVRNRPAFDIKQKRRIVYKLNVAELFETFLHKNYVGQKRFSLEGGEMLIPLLDAIIERAGGAGVLEIVMGMPHRGRLNVLTNILNKPYGMLFSEFEGNHMPEAVGGDGDVKYHLGFSANHVTADKHKVHLTLTANPSHLEAVDPVVEGRMRAKQRRFHDRDRRLGVPILIHGDAAFAGQGLVAETLNLSQLPGYRTGGTVHIVVNNQIGFTTSPSDGRSTRYCTDVAKMIEAPIFHVNGEDPEAVVFVGELALDFRQRFGRDVVIDMFCYRRHGHNEGDEPAFTQPLMYEKIKNRISIRELYTEQLVMAGDLTSSEAETIAETFADKLREVLEEVKRGVVEPANRPPGLRRRVEGAGPQIFVQAGRNGGRVRDAARDHRKGRPGSGRVHGQSQAGQDDLGARQDDGDEGDARLGVCRDAGLRLVDRRKHAGPAERPGQPPRHLQPAARGAGRPEDRRAVYAAQPFEGGSARILRLRQLALRGGRAGF